MPSSKSTHIMADLIKLLIGIDIVVDGLNIKKAWKVGSKILRA